MGLQHGFEWRVQGNIKGGYLWSGVEMFAVALLCVCQCLFCAKVRAYVHPLLQSLQVMLS